MPGKALRMVAKRPHKPKVQEIKSSSKIDADRTKAHRVALIKRGTYFDAKCQSCGRGAICGGTGAGDLLKRRAAWHTAKVETFTPNEIHEEGHDIQI